MVSSIEKVATVSNNKGQNALHLLAMNATTNASSMFECLFAAVPDYSLDVQDQNGNTGLFFLLLEVSCCYGLEH